MVTSPELAQETNSPIGFPFLIDDSSDLLRRTIDFRPNYKLQDLLKDRNLFIYPPNPDPVHEGGFADIYTAISGQTAKEVAIKRAKRPEASLFITDPDEWNNQFVQRQAVLEREAQVLSHFDHPNIPKVIDIIHHQRECLLVMEYLNPKEWWSINRALNTGHRISLENAHDILFQTASAITYAKEQGVPYGDLKPQHIMVNKEAQVKLIDWDGSSLVFNVTETADNAEAQFLASMGYVPWKILEGEGSANQREEAVIHAFGVIAFEMLTGEKLYTQKTILEMKQAYLDQEIFNRIQNKVADALQGYPEETRVGIGAALSIAILAPTEVNYKEPFEFLNAVRRAMIARPEYPKSETIYLSDDRDIPKNNPEKKVTIRTGRETLWRFINKIRKG